MGISEGVDTPAAAANSNNDESQVETTQEPEIAVLQGKEAAGVVADDTDMIKAVSMAHSDIHSIAFKEDESNNDKKKAAVQLDGQEGGGGVDSNQQHDTVINIRANNANPMVDQALDGIMDLPPPPTLGRNNNVRRPNMPGAVSVQGGRRPGSSAATANAAPEPPQNDEEQAQHGNENINDTNEEVTGERLLSATLVDEEDQGTIVEAHPALEGFQAILSNKRFKWVGGLFCLTILALVIPLAILLPGTGSGAAVQLEAEPDKTFFCGTASVLQADYRGTTNITENGRTCQRWDSQYPHTHTYKGDLDLFEAKVVLAENYCRNPDGVDRAWCYTTDPDVRYEYCNVTNCEEDDNSTDLVFREDCGSSFIFQMDYRGTINVSKSGKPCLDWNTSRYKTLLYPGRGIEANYCRTITQGSIEGREGAFCMTGLDHEWETCDVPICEELDQVNGTNATVDDGTCLDCTPQECGTEKVQQADYRGAINVTEEGIPCQRWDSQFPHEHGNTPEDKPWGALEENYCRNPDGDRAAWCYTTDPKIRFQYCDVRNCIFSVDNSTVLDGTPHECGYEHFKQADYIGSINTTENGSECQAWASQLPHQHSFSKESHPWAALDGNACRNPDGSDRAWCYTTDPDVRRQYCDVKYCKDSVYRKVCVDCGPEECGTLERWKQSDYRGTINTTGYGFACQRWDSQTPHEHRYSPDLLPEGVVEENYCRNPDGDNRGAWCYTVNENVDFDYCVVPECILSPKGRYFAALALEGLGSPSEADQTCGSWATRQQDYRGTKNTTFSGRSCQRWTSQRPHPHKTTPENWPEDDLREAFCRNPGGHRAAAWCFTTDEEVPWEYCGVDACEDASEFPAQTECGTLAIHQKDYRGNRSVTRSGLACMPWSLQDPHFHVFVPDNHTEADLRDNLCRNPDNSYGAWCFTMDPDLVWEYCDVPSCEEALEDIP